MRNFMQNCDQITELREARRHGSIADKDLTVEIAAQDWPYLYEKNYQIYMEAYNKSKELD